MLHRSPTPAGKAAQASFLGFRGTPSNIDLRADRRFNIEVAGVLQVVGTASAVYVVTVLDVSKSGVRVSCPDSLSEGTRVEVACCDTCISGSVRYSREVAAGEFYVGIKAGTDIDLAPFLEPIVRAG